MSRTRAADDAATGIACNFSRAPVFSGATSNFMKTAIALAFIAALVAFVLLPVSFVTAASALFGAGLTTIMISDYSRARSLRARPVAVRAVPARIERLELAA